MPKTWAALLHFVAEDATDEEVLIIADTLGLPTNLPLVEEKGAIADYIRIKENILAPTRPVLEILMDRKERVIPTAATEAKVEETARRVEDLEVSHGKDPKDPPPSQRELNKQGESQAAKAWKWFKSH